MIEDIIKFLHGELDCRLNELFNQYKYENDLVSIQNDLVEELRRLLDDWKEYRLGVVKKQQKGFAKYERIYNRIEKFRRKKQLEELLQ